MQYYDSESPPPKPRQWMAAPAPSPIALPRGVHRCQSEDYPDYWHMEIWSSERVCYASCYVHRDVYDLWDHYYHSALDLADPVPGATPMLRVI